MVEVRPFRGVRYNPRVFTDYSRVVCPPYDVIPPSEAEALRRRSPYNAVNLELPYEGPGESLDHNRYARPASLYLKWLQDGVLVREPRPTMYLLDEEFDFQGRTIRRRGLMAVVRLEEFDEGAVMPHERTTAGPIADRLALMRAARCNFSPLMCLYRDSEGTLGDLFERARRERPVLSVRLEEPYSYKLWAITDPKLLAGITDAMAPRQLFMADGHHRYEAALAYRNELRAFEGTLPPGSAARFVMMTLISLDDPGLLVLPYHRLLGDLGKAELAALRETVERAFQMHPVEPPSASPEEVASAIEELLAATPPDRVVVAVLGTERGDASLLTLKGTREPHPEDAVLERCDTWVLHQRAISPALGSEVEEARVSFVHDMVEAVRSVRSGTHQMAFLLGALKMDLFEEIVTKRMRLSPKSTCFYPKLPTGLAFNSLQGDL